MSELRTQADVFKLPTPEKGEVVYFDKGKPSERVTGLALRVRAAGSRKFVFFYRNGAGRLRKLTLGETPGWTLDEARKKARSYRVQLDNHEDPAIAKAEKRVAAGLLFSAVMVDYLADRKPKMKPRSFAESERHLKQHWKPLHGHALSAIDRATVAELLRKLKNERGAVAADRARSTLSAFFRWSIEQSYREDNPVLNTHKASEGAPRERVLSDAELVAIWNAAPDNSYGRIVKLLMLTAQRREEIGSLRWSEISDEGKASAIVLPGARTKNSRPHQVPLSPLAAKVIDAAPKADGRELVFGEGEGGYSGWSRSKAVLDEKCGVRDWTLHDLRRTAATRMASSPDDGGLGVLPHVVEAILNHVSGHKSGVAGVYNLASYSAEKRASLDLWGSYIGLILAKANGANVVRLARKRRKAS